jgi:hypothetical protein
LGEMHLAKKGVEEDSKVADPRVALEYLEKAA